MELDKYFSKNNKKKSIKIMNGGDEKKLTKEVVEKYKEDLSKNIMKNQSVIDLVTMAKTIEDEKKESLKKINNYRNLLTRTPYSQEENNYINKLKELYENNKEKYNDAVKNIFLEVKEILQYDFSNLYYDIIVPEAFTYNYSITIPYINKKNFPSYADVSIEKINLSNNKIIGLDKDIFIRLSQIKTLDLSFNKITKLNITPFDIESIENLEELILKKNKIKSIDNYTFTNLKKLKILDLSENKIESINSNVFSFLGNLMTLFLSNNKITIINANMFNGLVDLKTLDLSHNNIITIEKDAFSKLDKLNTLFLNNNDITIIDKNVFKPLINLETLHITHAFKKDNLSSNYLKIFHFNSNSFIKKPTIYSELSNKHIEANHTKKLSLTREIINRKYADLSIVNYEFNNSLYYDIGINIFTNDKFKNILTLNLSNNKISTIQTEQFNGLYSLKELNLSENMIDLINKNAFYGLSNLTKLNLCNNKISNGLGGMNPSIKDGAFSSLENLKILDLSENQLTLIKENAFSMLNNLKELDLSSNEISKIKNGAFSKLTDLKILQLSGNKIINSSGFNYIFPLPSIEKEVFYPLGNLTLLDLSNNQIEKIENNRFIKLLKLETLDLSKNIISIIKKNSFTGLTFGLRNNNYFKILKIDPINLMVKNSDIFKNLKKGGVTIISNNKTLQGNKNIQAEKTEEEKVINTKAAEAAAEAKEAKAAEAAVAKAAEEAKAAEAAVAKAAEEAKAAVTKAAEEASAEEAGAVAKADAKAAVAKAAASSDHELLEISGINEGPYKGPGSTNKKLQGNKRIREEEVKNAEVAEAVHKQRTYNENNNEEYFNTHESNNKSVTTAKTIQGAASHRRQIPGSVRSNRISNVPISNLSNSYNSPLRSSRNGEKSGSVRSSRISRLSSSSSRKVEPSGSVRSRKPSMSSLFYNPSRNSNNLSSENDDRPKRSMKKIARNSKKTPMSSLHGNFVRNSNTLSPQNVVKKRNEKVKNSHIDALPLTPLTNEIIVQPTPPLITKSHRNKNTIHSIFNTNSFFENCRTNTNKPINIKHGISLDSIIFSCIGLNSSNEKYIIKNIISNILNKKKISNKNLDIMKKLINKLPMDKIKYQTMIFFIIDKCILKLDEQRCDLLNFISLNGKYNKPELENYINVLKKGTTCN